MPKLLLVLAVLFTSSAFADNKEVLEAADQALRSEEGLIAEVHGVDQGVVIAYQKVSANPEKAFDYFVILPLRSNDPDIRRDLANLSLGRHDMIHIRGSVNQDGPPHITLTSIKLLDKYTRFSESYEHQTEPYLDLREAKEVVAKVHGPMGEMLVLEYKDANIYVEVPDGKRDLVSGLSRNDIVRVQYIIPHVAIPPLHVQLVSLEVLESISEENGKELTHCGPLGFFPAGVSGHVKSDSFFVMHELDHGLFRTYALDSGNQEEAQEIKTKLRAAWETHKSNAVTGRNFWFNPALKICATGRVSNTSPIQGNPIIVMSDAKGVQFVTE